MVRIWQGLFAVESLIWVVSGTALNQISGGQADVACTARNKG
ncbi:hypothetical protein [Neobacillus thermocopriae]|nr:hypothetical protein [Neobacillus thermocopriae]MED3623881.1 hypothetical protein [Neobacillus thermocopriae]MED3713337.1 hypothetical protein [Neobacillus thermocopriae]